MWLNEYQGLLQMTNLVLINHLIIDAILPHHFKKPFSITNTPLTLLLFFLYLLQYVTILWKPCCNNTLQGEYALIWLHSAAPDDCIRAEHAGGWELTLSIHPTCWIRLWIYLNSSELIAFRQAQNTFRRCVIVKHVGKGLWQGIDDQPWESHQRNTLTTAHYYDLSRIISMKVFQ